LFSGTGSVGQTLSHMCFKVVSLDKNPNRKADLPFDILEWDYKDFGVGYFAVIAASPPCEEYSAAKTVAAKNLEMAERIVAKTLEIIDFFQPEVWWIENPRSGLLKNREVVKGLSYVDLDYCQFCDWGYRKETRFWCSPELAKLKPKTCDRNTCSNCVPGLSGRRVHRQRLGGLKVRFSTNQKGRIPADVVCYLMSAAPKTVFTKGPESLKSVCWKISRTQQWRLQCQADSYKPAVCTGWGLLRRSPRTCSY